MSRIHLEDCALEYAGYWTDNEHSFVTALAGSDTQQRLATLQRASGYFKISRSFKRTFDVGAGIPRLQPVLDVLDRLATGTLTEKNLGTVVRDLRRDLGRPYGNRDLLSAATKFLWLLRRDVVIIHDSQARLALNAPHGDYDAYWELWHAAYSRRRDEVATACDRLSLRANRLAKSPEADRELRESAKAEWFQRRVFDIYLWKAGAPRQSSRPDA
jgi:hypothetical protein